MLREDYAPFLLMAWDRTGVTRWSWDGVRLAIDTAPAPPVSTSSYRSPEICAWRRARYGELITRPDAEALSRYHDDVAHPDPAFNVRMRRPDARTESVCRVTVTPTEVRFWQRRESPEVLAALDEQEARIRRVT